MDREDPQGSLLVGTNEVGIPIPHEHHSFVVSVSAPLYIAQYGAAPAHRSTPVDIRNMIDD